MKKKFVLKSNQDIEKLVKLRKSVGNKYYVIYYNECTETKVAISVSKKVGNAVVRNYQKRVVRDILTKNFNKLSNKQMLVVIKKNCLDISYQDKEQMLKILLSKINRSGKWENI